MDDKGMFNVEKAKEISNEHDEQHKKDNSIKLLELCAKGNVKLSSASFYSNE